MQRVKHQKGYRYIHPIMNDIDELYALVSDSEQAENVGLFSPTLDDSLKPIFDVICKHSEYSFISPKFEHKDIKSIALPKFDPKNIIVCYSGGKDSFSVIRHYQKLGYNVYAYHIRGLNKTYYDEWKVAEELTKTLGVPLYIDTVGYAGRHIWVEHPLKNMIMLNMAVTYGIREGITDKIATGNFRESSIDDVAFEVCGGDTRDMWNLYEGVLHRIIPKFSMYIPNKSYLTSYNLLLKEPQYLPLTISCLTPNRFRELFRNRTIKNYNIDLLPNRCGCCWKCATEYIFFTDHDVLPYNEAYYIHCMEVLLNTLEQETGYLIHNIQYVWKAYMPYSMKKSKAYKELKDAFIRSRKIKIAD